MKRAIQWKENLYNGLDQVSQSSEIWFDSMSDTRTRKKDGHALSITHQIFREVVYYLLEKVSEERQAKKRIDEYGKAVCEKEK